MPKILPAPCELVADKLPASPGYSYGRPNNITTATFLFRPGGVPSNVTGVTFGLDNGSLDVIATGTGTVDTYTLNVYQHDGAFTAPTLIATASVTAQIEKVLVKDIDYTQLAPLAKNRQIAIEVVPTGTITNIGVDLQLSGDT